MREDLKNVFNTDDGGIVENKPEVEKPVEKVEETKPEDVSPEPKEPEKQPEPEKNVDTKVDTEYLAKLKEITGQEFDSDDSLKTFFEDLKGKASKADDFLSKREEYETRLAEYDELSKYIQEHEADLDPINHWFGGDKEKARRYALAEKLISSGKDGNLVQKYLSIDPDQTDSLELLSLERQLNSKRVAGKDTEVKKMILKSAGVDVDDPEFNLSSYRDNLTPDQLASLDIQADDAIQRMNKEISSIELKEPPQTFKTIQEKVASKKESYTNSLKAWSENETQAQLNESLDKVDFTSDGIDFTYDIDPKDKAKLLQDIAIDAARHGLEVNEKNLKTMVAAAKHDYAHKNMIKIMSSLVTQGVSKAKKDHIKDTYNGGKVSMDTKAPETKKSKDDTIADGIEAYLTKRSKLFT